MMFPLVFLQTKRNEHNNAKEIVGADYLNGSRNKTLKILRFIKWDGNCAPVVNALPLSIAFFHIIINQRFGILEVQITLGSFDSISNVMMRTSSHEHQQY